MGHLADGLEAAVHKAFTRPIPKTAGARMRYLVKQLKGTKAAAQVLGITQRTVERYVKDQIKRPRKDLAARMEREVTRRWQPQIRAQAKQKAATTDGIVIDTRARFGYEAAPGSTDDARLRHLTVALPPTYARRLFEAQAQGAAEHELSEIAAEALQEVYFKDAGRRASGLLVKFTDVEHVEFDL
ncbi:telomere-protecting terminal protein Tpg [Streptomyces pristinaespiralis]|uniref:telomere-protecting terminal protein Tpg n=1 Tax=Streptomyces pristinaespiralis TaxID=38300 RepID=UPI0033C0FF02